MSYFSHFPVVGYGIDSTTGKIITAKNIILRAKFSDYAKKHSSNMVSYKIKDEDRPDTIAYKLYGQSSLHWVVLLFADIMNPYYQWPLKQNELEIILSKKYSLDACISISLLNINDLAPFWLLQPSMIGLSSPEQVTRFVSIAKGSLEDGCRGELNLLKGTSKNCKTA
jgi:hypothetical protein